MGAETGAEEIVRDPILIVPVGGAVAPNRARRGCQAIPDRQPSHALPAGRRIVSNLFPPLNKNRAVMGPITVIRFSDFRAAVAIDAATVPPTR
jgi:hypothetical protein